MAASDKFTDKEREQTMQPKGRYARQRCYAAGCPYHAVLMTNPDAGEGLCEFHSAAEISDTWPKISNILRRYEFLVMQHELFVLDGIKHLGYAKCKSQIARVQKAALACGMDRDFVQLQKVNVWKYGQQCVETEVPAAFHYRVSMEFVRHVVNLAKPDQQTRSNYLQTGMNHIDTALKLIAGELMPSHIRPAGEAV